MNQGKKSTLILVLVLILLVVVGGAVIFLRFKASDAPAETNEPTVVQEPLAEPEVTESPEPVEVETVESLSEEVEEVINNDEIIVDSLPELDDEYSFYQKLAKGGNVNILIMGDDTAKGTGASEPGQSTDGKDHRWFTQLSDHLSEKYLSGHKPNVVSLAASDASLIQDALNLKESTDTTDYDLILLSYGINEGETNSAMPFETLIITLRDKYPNASIITTLEPCAHAITAPLEYMRGVSNDYGIPVINLFDYFYNTSLSNGMDDYLKHFDVHEMFPNDQGQDEWFELLKKEIDANVEARTEKLKDRKPLDPKSKMFADMQYIPVTDSRVKRVDDTTFTVDAKANGLVYMVHKENLGNKDAKVIADDILYELRKPNGILLSSGDYLTLIYGELMCENSFSITFSNKEYADGLKGFYFYFNEPEV